MKPLDDVQQTLLLELHRLVDESAKRAAAKLGAHQKFVPMPVDGDSAPSDEFGGAIAAMQASLVTYPPTSGVQLTRAEHEALAEMEVSPVARTAFEKLFADAASEVIFHFLCLIDGVGDPAVAQIKRWTGADLTKRKSRGDREMLHDAFYESYWRYLELTKDRTSAR